MREVLDTAQHFARVNGELDFIHTVVLFRQDGLIFCGTSPSKRKVDVHELDKVRPIPPESYCPLLPTFDCTIAPHPSRCYIKTPNLMSCGDHGDDLANLVLQELAMCEMIREQPHRNLATYYGCQVSHGRITGLCFQKYPETLLHRINPGHLNKSMLMLSEDRAAVRKKAAHYLQGIEEWIRHLHSLGRVHNDINPANIMITEDDIPVIINFDSSSASGTSIDGAKARRACGWFDPRVHVSQQSNDFDALAELRVWLTSSSPAELQFGF